VTESAAGAAAATAGDDTGSNSNSDIAKYQNKNNYQQRSCNTDKHKNKRVKEKKIMM